MYTGLSLLCGIAGSVLYFWNKPHWYSGVLYALPAGALLAEGIACAIVLVSKHMLLGQTIFDLTAAAWFSAVLGKKAPNKFVFAGTLAAFAAIVFSVVYLNWIAF